MAEETIENREFPSLPADCPPADAVQPAGPYYRIVKENPFTDQDFRSAHELGLHEGRDECQRRGLSVFTDLSDAQATRARYPMIGEYVAVGDLGPTDGLVKQTGRPSHHTWWVANNLEPATKFRVDIDVA